MLKASEQAPSVTLCFAAKTLFLEKDGAMESVEAIELVKAGQILASLDPIDPPPDRRLHRPGAQS
ncbi:MAG: hypothetical protein K0A99_05565 [Desulfoarculaceae bacterium]|nr:hypothetical protein [Desulfoarculaceae bacterium]